MQSRFEFLEEQFPKLAGYGEKAEEAFGADNNICLLNLGRMAEYIIEILRRSGNIDEKISVEEVVDRLRNLEIIDADITRKIHELLEIKHEAIDSELNSEVACSRLLTTAKELCEWFVLKHGESKFSFLADLFLPGRYIPPLANLAEIGREAEENLYSNTRYCIICLGDMGEAIVDYLLSINSIETHEREQMGRIDSLYKAYIIDDEVKNALHDLRMARNKAVHERYDNNYTSEEEARRLLDEVLKLCEWLFRLVLKPGYIVKGRISGRQGDNISVLIGSITAQVSLEEIPLDNDGKVKSYVRGKKYIFKVLEKTSDTITLSLKQADEDYNLSIAQQYSKYKIGQDLNVVIKRISNSSGALVELKDGLEAKIPYSEIGRRLYDFDEANEKQIKYEVTARVKWFSTTQYPPMLLSIKDIEEERRAERESSKQNKWEKIKIPPKKKPLKDIDFITLCKSADFGKVFDALDGGANPNAKNRNNNTALMSAAQYNHEPKVIEALLDAGADIEARNKNGNTALHFAAMYNTVDVVEILCKRGADVEALNHEKKNALDYARSSKKLNDEPYIINLLTPKSEKGIDEVENEAHKTKPSKESSKPSEYKGKDGITTQLLKACESGGTEEIAKLIEAGANVNAKTANHSTPLMLAAQHNTLEAVKILLDNKADVNAQNKTGNTALTIAAQFKPIEFIEILLKHNADISVKNKLGNTALHIACGFNSSEAVMALINAGADLDLNVTNEKGFTPVDIIKKNAKLKGSDAWKFLMRPKLQKEFLSICLSGTEEEISEAINAGVNVNSKNKSLSTALMLAASKNTAEAVNLLIKAGAYIDAQNIYGKTALIYAVSSNNEDVVEVLIDAGADVAMKDTSGYSAAYYAKKNYKLADTEVLLQLGSRK